ncbi:hypothetical protein WCLP8_820003 [uncultured Gammaproteobacteria bacterium]
MNRNDAETQTRSLPDSLEDTFFDNPLMTAIKLSRFKFIGRLLSPEDRVLDLGCGTGYGSYFFASMIKGDVVGIDAYADIDYAIQTFSRPNLRFLRGDMRHPPDEITRRRFDAVVSVDSIEHFSKDEGCAILDTYARLLEPGGTMIIGTPNALSATYRSARTAPSTSTNTSRKSCAPCLPPALNAPSCFR